MLARELDRLFPVSRLRHDFMARPHEQVAQIQPDDGLVLCNQNAHVP